MVPTLYSSISAEYHIKRLNYILEEHSPFFNVSLNQCELVSKDLNSLIETSKIYFNNINEMRQKMMGGIPTEPRETQASSPQKTDSTNNVKNQESSKSEKKVDPPKEKNLDQMKKNSPSSNSNTTPNASTEEMNEGKQKVDDSIKSIHDVRQKISEMDFKKFSLNNFPDSFIYEDNPKPQKYKCLNSILKSSANQLVSSKDRNGDLLYLDVYTLENTIISVTCGEKGFFVNSTKNGIFDARPANSHCSSYTLVGLLCQASASFKENFSKLISQILNVEPTIFLPSPQHKYEWLRVDRPSENPLSFSYRYKSFNSEMDSLKHMRLNKEWNEEFQAVIDLNFTQDPLQNLTKEKLLNDFYKMFKETAIEGVKLIRERKITPFNFFDNPKANSGYFMYGSIFFTVLEDNYLDFRTFTKDDQKQTCLGSSLDLRHINYLNSIRHIHEIKDFYFSLNCIVSYKGLRVHAQVITPGVIFNSEHLVEYGEGEEGQVKWNQSFHDDYKKLCEKLNIREIVVLDKNNAEYKICGNPEIKGVRGVDKRKYLFDLIHLLPRDLNFEGSDCNGCLIRPELIKEYSLKQIHNKTTTDYSEEMKKINSEIPQEQPKNPESYLKFIEEKFRKKEELFETISKEIKSSLTMDTSIGIDNKFLKFKNEKSETDENLLRNMSKFLKEEMLVKFLTDISKDEEGIPNDSFTLTTYLHRYGIPTRYYGEILKLIDNETNFKKSCNWVKTLIIRDIIRRSSKHLFNSLVKDVPEYLIKDFCSYFLNLLLAPPNTLKSLENNELHYENGSLQFLKQKENHQNTNYTQNVTQTNTQSTEQNLTAASKKKKKNKKKKGTKTETSDEKFKYLILDTLTPQVNRFFNCFPNDDVELINKFFLKPSVFWSKIKEISQKRFFYEMPDKPNFDYVEVVMNKFGLLRDFCLTVGLQVKAHDYEIYYEVTSRMDGFKYSNLPFKPQNIVDFFPVVKDYQLPSEIHKPIYEQAESMFKAGNFFEAAEKYRQLIYLSNEVYGQINYYSAVAHKKLGEISYLEGDPMNCIVMLQKAIVIFEKLYDYDSNVVANAYSELSTYYHLINQDYLAFKYISRGLEILNFTYPKNHPELVNRACSLAMYYVDLDLVDNAKELIESTVKLCNSFFNEEDKNLQRAWLILSHLSIKTYNLNRAVTCYEKYLNIIRKNTTDEIIVKNGDKIMEGLKTISDELKKKQNFIKNKEDTKKLFDELCKKYLSPMYWEDLEKPFHRLIFDPNTENSYLNLLLKKKAQTEKSEEKINTK